MPHREKSPNAGGNRCVCMSNTGISAMTCRVAARTTSARSSGSLSGGRRSNSGNEGLPAIAGIRPAVVWHERRPAGPCRILIVRVVALFAIEVLISGQLLAVETDAKPRPLVVWQLSALDDVVGEVVVVRVGSERQVRHHGPEMQHRGQLDAKLAGRMHGDAELKRLADSGGLDAPANATPERSGDDEHGH